MIGQLEDYKLLTFNHNYVIHQVHRTIRHHIGVRERLSHHSPRAFVRSKTFGPLRDWGLGKIHNSYTPFFWIGGSHTRTPMQHPAVSRDARKTTGQFLTGTGEQMHSSVRVRMALGGLGYNDEGSYESDALHGWKYEWADYAMPNTPFQLTQPGEVGRLKNVEWVKFSPGGATEVARMPEDKMTNFERVVLRHWTGAERDWEEGADEREKAVDCARPIRRETDTFEKETYGQDDWRLDNVHRDWGFEKELNVTTKRISMPEDLKIAAISNHDMATANPTRKRLSLITNFRS